MLSRSYYSLNNSPLPLNPSLIISSKVTGRNWIIPPENQGMEENLNLPPRTMGDGSLSPSFLTG